MLGELLTNYPGGLFDRTDGWVLLVIFYKKKFLQVRLGVLKVKKEEKTKAGEKEKRY